MKKRYPEALLLAAAMMLSVCACGSKTIEAYNETDSTMIDMTSKIAEAADNAEAADTEPAEQTETKALDFAAAFAKHDPEDVVFYVDGDGVTWRELFYQVCYYTSYVALVEDRTVTDWNEACSLFQDSEGKYYTYGTAILQNAVTFLKQYHVMYNHLIEAGVEYSEESQAEVAALRQQSIDDSFDGDEQAFLDYLDSMYCTEELWLWFNQVDAMYAVDGFNTLYGEMGKNLSDEDVMDYASGDPYGNWTEYVQLRLIWLYDAENASAEPTEDASDEITAEEIIAQLDKAGDKDAAFTELYDLYNRQSAMDNYPDGWCVYEGDTDDAIYEAALAMGDNEYSAVDTADGQVIVMRVPIDPDCGVYYDETTDTVYTLRYYAAWQAYSDLINGEDGWINTADAQWAEGFEDFTLNDVF